MNCYSEAVFADYGNNNEQKSIVKTIPELINLTASSFFYDNINVGFQWIYGNNREYGYSLNINISTGDMRFYYRQNDQWILSWQK